LPKDRQIEIVKKLDLLPINPMLLDIVKMKGYENTYRIRIGKYCYSSCRFRQKIN